MLGVFIAFICNTLSETEVQVSEKCMRIKLKQEAWQFIWHIKAVDDMLLSCQLEMFFE